MNYFIKQALMYAVLMHCTPGSTFSMHFLQKSATIGQSKASFTKAGQMPFYKPIVKNDIKQIHIFAPKNGKKELSQETHKKVYSASLKHEFPTAPFYNKNYDPSQCETKTITQDVSLTAPEVDVLWIPRTLYELFIIQHYHDSLLIPHGYTGFLENNDLQPLLDINNHQYNITLHKEINDTIIAFLQQHPKQKNTSDNDYFTHLAKELLKNLPLEISKLEKIILNAIIYEIETHQKHPKSFILYRGGPLDKRDFNIQLNYALNPTEKFLPKYISLSFGLGFFAAYFTDVGACTAHICTPMTPPHVYALPVDKNSLCKNSSAFFLPPLAPIPNFFSKGEAFHGRTKIPLTSYEQKTVPLYDGWCTNQAPFPENLIIENNDCVMPWYKRTAFYKSLYCYLIDKAHPLNQTTAEVIEKIKKQLPEE
jgi:hypothetical protein